MVEEHGDQTQGKWPMTRTALIAGATGAASKRLVEVLLADGQWSVIGLSRHPPAATRERLRYVRADLLDAASCHEALAQCRGVTHVFYTARAKFGEGGVEDVEQNVAMLRNVIDAIEPVATGLEHVHLVEGTKWYGMHLGSMATPAREDDPRHMPPNFYYDQEDLLRARQVGKRWSWSASRPNFIYDYAPERPRNLVSTIGAWAAISAELGLPLDFPGRPGAFTALTEMTDATHLARAMAWMAVTPAARNQAYNVTDGSVIRWRRFWPRLAEHFGIKVGEVRPLALGEWMRDKGPVWDRIVARHGLKPTRMDELALWPFADFLWHREYDVISSVMKLRRDGFHDTIDTEEQVLAHLRRYREERLLP
jgi:nucleoside-diphosphate-sugar epimerase